MVCVIIGMDGWIDIGIHDDIVREYQNDKVMTIFLQLSGMCDHRNGQSQFELGGKQKVSLAH